MKKILFGIALIIFGMYCVDMSVIIRSFVVQTIGTVIPVVGMIFAIAGFIEKDKQTEE